GSSVDIRLNFFESESKVEISIEDKGSGIDPRLLSQIFNRLRYLDEQPVPGLGLPLAHRIAQTAGGFITINSSSQGTKVAINLPALVGNAA
ncbi:MAG: ATP-binding protein, partial [Cyanobacteria bacterium]|nr:ATP-binding protein [Cyanobacteriota bacterium]